MRIKNFEFKKLVLLTDFLQGQIIDLQQQVDQLEFQLKKLNSSNEIFEKWWKYLVI